MRGHRFKLVFGFGALLGLLTSAACDSSSASGGGGNCNGGCLCSPVESCPTGCYPSQTVGTSEAFCSNGIVTCDPSGTAWSTGTPMNNCGNGNVVFVDAGPKGAFCCATPVEDAGGGADANANGGDSATNAATGDGSTGDAGEE